MSPERRFSAESLNQFVRLVRAATWFPSALPHAPTASLNCECPDIPPSRSEAIERPTLDSTDIARNTKLRRRSRRIRCQRDRKTVQRGRQTRATGFKVGLLLRPTSEKGFGTERAGESRQIINFGCGEEMPRDVGVIGLRPEVFEINADVGVGDRDESKTG